MDEIKRRELEKICEELAVIARKVGSLYKNPTSEKCYQLNLDLMMLQARINTIANGSNKNRT